MTNAELARNGFEELRQGNLDAIAELLAPDVRWHGGDPDAEGACRNRGEALGFMRRALDNGVVPDVIDVTESGDEVFVRHARGGVALTFRDGKIVEMVHRPG